MGCRMWRSAWRRAAVVSVSLAALLLASSFGSVIGPQPRDGVMAAPASAAEELAIRALAAPAHSGPYPIFNFKNADSPVIDPRTGYVYVADDGFARTTIYDPARSAVIGFIDGVAGAIGLDNASDQLVVLQGDGAVFVNLSTGAVVATLSGLAPEGWRRPVLAVDSADGLAFAAYNFQTSGAIWLGSTIHVLSFRQHAAIATVGGLWFTQGITYDALDGRVYATNPIGGLTVIDPKTFAVVGTLSGLDGPNQVAVNPLNGYLYIPCWNGRVLAGTTGWTFTAGVSIVDPATLQIVDNLSGFKAESFGPTYIVYDPGDASFYIANSSAIVALSAESAGMRYQITGLSFPGPLAVDLENGHVYAAQGDGLVEVDPATQSAAVVGNDYHSPWGIAVDPMRNRVYASNHGGSDVVVINAATDRIIGHIPGFQTPDTVLYDLLADELFVGNENGYGNYSLSIVNLTTEQSVGSISGVNPWTARFDNHTGNVLVGTDTGLMVISGRTNAILENVTAFGGLSPLAVDGMSGRVFALRVPDVFSPGPYYLLAIRTTDWSVQWNLTLTNLSIYALGFDPVNGNLYDADGTVGVAVLDGSTGQVVARIPGPWEPADVLYDPANGYVYISDRGPYGNLWVIDPTTNQMQRSFELPDQGNRMAYNPVTQEIYVAVGMLGLGSGLVVAVPSVAYPPPPVTQSPWFWPLVGFGVVVVLVALVVVLRQRKRRRPAPVEPSGPAPSSPPSNKPETPGASPPGPEEPPPLPRTVTFAALAVVLALLLASAALFGPWFVLTTQTTTGPVPATDSRGYAMGGWSATDRIGTVTAYPAGSYVSAPSVGSVFAVVEAMTIAALLATLLACVLLVSRGRTRRGSRIAILLGFAAGAVSLAAPIGFAWLFPTAAIADGLLPPGSLYLGPSWGAGFGWVCLVLAGVLVLVGFLLLARWLPRELSPAPPGHPGVQSP